MRKKTALLCLTCLLFCLNASALADEVILTLGGDCVLGTREEWKDDPDTFDTLIAEKGYGWCFAKIAEPFQSDDVSLVNLEGVLQSDSQGHQRGKEFTFRGAPAYTAILSEAGIEQVNIANNHYIDFSRDGRESTRAALEAGGIGLAATPTAPSWRLTDIKSASRAAAKPRFWSARLPCITISSTSKRRAAT